MIIFKVSAPGSLSLFGEHAVKYGKAGVTASIDLCTTIFFREAPLLDDTLNTLNLFSNSFRLHVDYRLDRFLKFYYKCVENMKLLRERVLEFVDTTYQLPNRKRILRVFYYLLILITYKEDIEIIPFSMDLFTEFTMDHEFASPASFTVCLAASLLHWSRLQNGVHNTFDDDDLKRIQKYAARCEEISFEFGNLVDVTACTYGTIIKHQLGETMCSSNLFDIPNMTILVVDLKHMQNVISQTQQATEMSNTIPQSVDCILNAIDAISKRVFDVFQQLVEVQNNNELSIETKRNNILQFYNVFKNCIRSNQNLLQALNVSHYNLNEICLIALTYGMYGKYTDIGNGRYAYIWCPQYLNEECIMPFLLELKNCFKVMKTKFAHSGVKIDLITPQDYD